MRIHREENLWCTCWRCFLKSPQFAVAVVLSLLYLMGGIYQFVATYPPGGLCGWPLKPCEIRHPQCAFVYADRHVECKPCEYPSK